MFPRSIARAALEARVDSAVEPQNSGPEQKARNDAHEAAAATAGLGSPGSGREWIIKSPLLMATSPNDQGYEEEADENAYELVDVIMKILTADGFDENRVYKDWSYTQEVAAPIVDTLFDKETNNVVSWRMIIPLDNLDHVHARYGCLKRFSNELTVDWDGPENRLSIKGGYVITARG